IEDESAKPGKILAVNDQDRDDDDIPGFADGFNLDGMAGTPDDISAGVEFTRLVLEIPAPIDLDKAKIKFLYSASDPAGVTRVAGVGGGPPTYTPALGSLRIWTKNGGTQRDKDSVVGGGDFVPSNVVLTPAQLGVTGATRTITLFVEGIQLGAKQIEVEVTPTGDAAQLNCKDAVRVTAVIVRFSRAPETDAGNRYGYDEMFAQDPNDDHVSVKKEDFTFVKVTIQGLADASKIAFVSRDASVAKVEVPGKTPAAGFLLKILGQNKNKNQTEVDARLGTATGEVCATINVNVYHEIELMGKYYRVFKTGAEDDTIPPAIPAADITKKANSFLKYPVVRASLAAPKKFGVAFDPNDNGRVDYYNNGPAANPNPETGAIYKALKDDGAHYTDMVLLKDTFIDNWYISANVAKDDTTISMPGTRGLYVGGTYRLSNPKNGNAETFKITAITANKITIDTDPAMPGNQGFARDHKLTADPKTSETVKAGNAGDGVIGLSSNIGADQPALVVGANAAIIGELLAHEQMHGQKLSDVNNARNVMHYTTPTNITLLPFTFFPQVAVITGTPNPKPGPLKENQWQIPMR
ncbi:MAG: hypothetical protein JOZ57_02475, partial [Abitibacteriaceae bacterium]|nr:hypothetical protein [Abditibacteriaceae bacterium]